MGKAKFWSNPEIRQGRGHITKTAYRVHPNITENHGDTTVLSQSDLFDNTGRDRNNCSRKTSGTIETEQEMHKLLDDCTTRPNATLRYKESRMVLKAHSAVLYLLESLERSRQGGGFYMGGKNEDNNQRNGSIMVISAIMCNVMSLAAEVECKKLLYDSKELEVLSTTLIDMGHSQ